MRITILIIFLLFFTSTYSQKLFEKKKEPLVKITKSGPYIGLQRGKYNNLEMGYEFQRKAVKLIKPTTHAINAGFDYNLTENILGFSVRYWQKRGRLDLTYGGTLVFKSNFDQNRIGFSPTIGYKLSLAHLQVGYNILTPFDTFKTPIHFLYLLGWCLSITEILNGEKGKRKNKNFRLISIFVKMQLFYNPTIETDLILEKEEHTHATKVLRKQVGDAIWALNGKGDLFECELTQIGSKKSHVVIINKQSFDSTNNLHIAIAPTKNNNRMEFFLEKATEIGITEITPILCDRSERKVLKSERMNKIIISAAKQSKSFHFPVLNPMISFSELVKNNNSTQTFIAHCEEEGEKKNLLSYNLNSSKSTLILIGPEGDFSQKEIQLAKEAGFIELSLGETRLRTETAALVACTHYSLSL